MSDTDKTLAIILICIIMLSLFPVAGYLAIILLLSHLIRRNKVGELFNVVKKDLGLIFLLSALVLSTFFSKYQFAGLVGLTVFAMQLLLYVIIRSRITDKGQNLNIIRYILLTSLMVSVVGVVQYHFSHMSPDWIDTHLYSKIPNRAFSTLYNPNVLGSYFIIIISIAVAGFNCFDKKHGRLMNTAVLIAAALCMILTFSRGAWLGLAVSILLIFIFSEEKPYILTVIGITVLLALPELEAVLSRINPGLLSDDSSNTYRQYLWTMAVETFKGHPLLGTGLSTFGFSLPSHSTAAGYLISHAHNIYLQMLAETGLLGFTAFFGYILNSMYVCFKLFRHSRCKQTRNLALGSMASFIGLLVHGSVDATLYLPQLSIFVWITTAVIRNAGDFEYVTGLDFSKVALWIKPVLGKLFANIR